MNIIISDSAAATQDECVSSASGSADSVQWIQSDRGEGDKLSSSLSLPHVQVDYGFPEGSVCEDSAHILTLSMPISCNSALLAIVGEDGLPVDLVTGADDLGDLCQTYCTTPMRQVGVDCQALNIMHQSITGACDTNNNSIRYTPIHTHTQVHPSVHPCTHTRTHTTVHTHTLTHTTVHAHTHTHTHTHKRLVGASP